jgi:hypothetical protein
VVQETNYDISQHSLGAHDLEMVAMVVRQPESVARKGDTSCEGLQALLGLFGLVDLIDANN